MIFVGDISLPNKSVIKVEIPNQFHKKLFFGNLEGSLVKNTNDVKLNYCIYNNYNAINDLVKNYNYVGFSLANNHILDFYDVDKNLELMNKLGVYYNGLISNQTFAQNQKLFESENEIIVLCFGWEVIQCRVAKDGKSGVAPLTKNYVLEAVTKTQKNNPNARIVTFMHWSYELESEPQPFERELAKKIIDLGVDAVIGTHPHRVGGIEVYKNRPIVYSLGNWLFPQNYFFNGKHSFPDFCSEQLAFEINFTNNEYKFHLFEFDARNSTVKFKKSFGISDNYVSQITPFHGLSNSEYIKWYKNNHYHKYKGLPTYTYSDSKFAIDFKNTWNKFRDLMIRFIKRL